MPRRFSKISFVVVGIMFIAAGFQWHAAFIGVGIAAKARREGSVESGR